jgi:hypothetical protein
MQELRNKIVLILSVTWNILRHPFRFGKQIADDISETKRAGRYLFEGGIFAFAVYQFVLKRAEVENFLIELPFAEELFAAFLLASVLLTSLMTHYVAKLLSSKTPSIHASLARFLYWSGFCFFVMLPVVGLVIFALQGNPNDLGISPTVIAVCAASILVPLIAVYYIGTISSWIGHAYGMTPTMGGVAILFSYALSSAAAMGLLALINSVIA